MQVIKCEMCNGNDFVKEGGYFVCQHCGTKYTVDEAKKLMIEGTVDIQGTVKVDNSAFVEKCLANARRARQKEDWEEVEKYYNLLEQNVPDNIEAIFFSAYGRVVLSLADTEYAKREQKFSSFIKTISIISDCYETTNENKEEVLRSITFAIQRLLDMDFMYKAPEYIGDSSFGERWQKDLFEGVVNAYLSELDQISQKYNEPYIQELKSQIETTANKLSHGCYVATCIYGSYDCPQVWTLRRYRDNTLAETWHGRAFIHMYYAISPTIVKWFGNTKWFRRVWQNKLDKMVKHLNEKGVKDTPYKDKLW